MTEIMRLNTAISRGLMRRPDEPNSGFPFALTDRVWQGGEAFARAALLVEEAALELARG